MEHIVLGLLMLQSHSVYGLKQAFRQGISTFYSASLGNLQIAVRNLQRKGWVVFREQVENGRRKKVYSITSQGRQAFQEWMLDEVPVNRLEVTALSKVFFLGLMKTKEQKKQIVQAILDKIELVHDRVFQMDQGISRSDVPDSHLEFLKYQLKTLDYGIQVHDFSRGWFQNLLQEIEDSA